LQLNANEIATRFLKPIAYQAVRRNRKTRGRVVHFENNKFIPEQQGFSTEDILWAVGIWSVILTLSPVVVFYVLMVA
jgi:hypothetical protein